MSSTALRSSHLRCVLGPLSCLIFLFLLAASALADSQARIVRLSYLDGDVGLDKGDGRGFSTAYLNMPVTQQSKLWARDGQAEVEFEDGSSIRLTPDTMVAFNDLSLDNNGGRNSSVELKQGTAYFDIHPRDSDHFQLQFGREQVQLLKSARFRVDADKSQFEVAVMSGEIQVSSASGTEVAVKKDETIRLDNDDPDRYYLAKGIDTETYDSWDSDRAKSHDQAVATANARGGNNVTYGLSDLNAYGNYFYVPGYGNLWRPASVGLGWDPFADGYWVSYPGFGYTFVSGYPWGWAPYRYGSWQFVNGYGWCWAPGSNWNNWQAVPPVRNLPPRYRPPIAPRHGPPVLVVNNGVAVPAPQRQIVIDNDSLDHRRPHSTKLGTANGEMIRQGPSSTTPPAQGFVATPATAPTPPAGVAGSVAPGAVIASPARPMIPRVGGNRRIADDGDISRGAQLNQMRQAAPAPNAAVSVPNNSAAAAHAVTPSSPPPPARIAPPVRSEGRPTPMMNPRMESRGSPAPMHMESHPMGSSAGMSRSMSSMSSGGGARMSAPSTGGGGHSSGGGSSHGSHR
jgi:uncharacterized protein DUF6600/FecR-like protein